MSTIRFSILFTLPFLCSVVQAAKPSTADPTFALSEAKARMKPVLVYVYDTR